MTGSARLCSFLGALLLAGCATFAPPPAGPEPAFVPPAPFPAGRAPVALVLSGGGARGFAHVGVIKVLEANGLRPDLIVGTSAGSIVGALYASGLSASELETAIETMDYSVFSDFVIPGLGFLPGEMGLIKGDKLHRFIDHRARHHRIEDFPIRFAAVATDLSSGQPVAFNTGDVGRAVLASSAVPGAIMPARIGGRRYVDGQITSPLPVAAARSLGAKVVIAVDVIYPPQHAFVYSVPGVLFQAFAITAHRLKEHELAQADVVISPDLWRVSGQLGFADRRRVVAAGERAALEALPKIRAAKSAAQ